MALSLDWHDLDSKSNFGALGEMGLQGSAEGRVDVEDGVVVRKGKGKGRWFGDCSGWGVNTSASKK